jgi:hypothetical protein
VYHPNWPAIWPRMLTDGKIIEVQEELLNPQTTYDYA